SDDAPAAQPGGSECVDRRQQSEPVQDAGAACAQAVAAGLRARQWSALEDEHVMPGTSEQECSDGTGRSAVCDDHLAVLEVHCGTVSGCSVEARCSCIMLRSVPSSSRPSSTSPP